MTTLISTEKVCRTIALALLFSMAVSTCYAQAQVTRSFGTFGATPPGCDQSAQTALANTGNSAYSTAYTAATQIVTPPSSYSSCLTGLLQKAQQSLDLFNGQGNIGSLFNTIANSAITSMVSTLENTACSQVSQLAGQNANGGFAGEPFFSNLMPQNLYSPNFPGFQGGGAGH